ELGYDADYLAVEHAQLVRSVQKNSPAEAAGLRPGDRIRAIEGHPLADEYYQPVEWRKHSPGDTVHLTVERSGAPRALRLTGTFRLRVSTSREIPWVEYVGNEIRNFFPLPF